MSGYRVHVVRHPNYLHSRVFDRLANVLTACLHDLHMHDDKGRQIVLGANLVCIYPDVAQQIAPESIIYNLEAHSSPWMRHQGYLELLEEHTVLDYTPNTSHWYCPILYHHSLETLTLQAPEIDVLFYGAPTPRRNPILAAVEETGLLCTWVGHEQWDECDHWIARTKMVLNIHAYDNAPLEMVRLSYLLANGVFILTEGPVVPEYEGMMVFADADEIAEKCKQWASDRWANERAIIAKNGQQRFRRMLQTDVLRKCLEAPQ